MTIINRYRAILLFPLVVFIVTLPVNLYLHQPLITFVPTLAALYWSSRKIYTVTCPSCGVPLREGRFFLFGLSHCKRCGAPLN